MMHQCIYSSGRLSLLRYNFQRTMQCSLFTLLISLAASHLCLRVNATPFIFEKVVQNLMDDIESLDQELQSIEANVEPEGIKREEELAVEDKGKVTFKDSSLSAHEEEILQLLTNSSDQLSNDEQHGQPERRTVHRQNTYMCNNAICDPDRYAEFTQSLCGYNVIIGEPYTFRQADKIDPGIRNQLFVPATEVNGLMTLTGITAFDTMTCTTKASSKAVTNVREFQEQVAEFSSRESGFGYEQSVEIKVEPVDGIEATTDVTRSAKAAFTNSNQMGAVKEFFRGGKNIMVMTEAQCMTARLTLKEYDLPPFDSGFANAITTLAATSDASDVLKLYQFNKFIQEYGTHYMQSSTLGAKIMETTFLRETAKRDFTSSKLEECSSQGFNIDWLAFQASDQRNTCSDKFSKEINENGAYYEDKITVTKGSKPAEGGVSEWASQEFVPEVLRMELKPIVNLFSDTILAKQGLNVDAGKMRSWFIPLYNDICANSDYNCDIPKGCGYTDDCPYNKKCVDNPAQGTFECQQLNLCEIGNGGCAHVCTPGNDGTVQCSCRPGFVLEADGKSCDAMQYAVLVNANVNCYDRCKNTIKASTDGKCTSVCGEDGYCCRRGYTNTPCPSQLKARAPDSYHTCLLYTTRRNVPIRVNNNDCYKGCNKRGGSCDRTCGSGGYCCRNGYSGCSTDLYGVADTGKHICVGYVAKFENRIAEAIDVSINCWNGCGSKGGECSSVCGAGGWCCRRTYTNCPVALQAAATLHKHTCVRYRA